MQNKKLMIRYTAKKRNSFSKTIAKTRNYSKDPEFNEKLS